MRWADHSDSGLAVAVGRWEQDALEELYRRHGGAVHGLARRVSGSGAVADEITQEVFTRFWREPQQFDPERGSLRAWLLVHTHRRAVDYVRSESSRQQREQRYQRPDATGDLDRELEELIASEQVRNAVKALPEQQREPVVLAYFGGYTYREVAAMLSVAEGTIKSRIRAGLSNLRAGLAAGGVGLA